MKPLLSVICYNRKKETIATLKALGETRVFQQANVCVWDNGSTDGTGQAVFDLFGVQDMKPPGSYWTMGGANDTRLWLDLWSENIGCPYALNEILFMRSSSQHFIKVDNDVVLETQDWVLYLCQFLDAHPEVAMVSPWYEELETANQGRISKQHEGWWEIFPVIGHCVMHRGAFLDQTGFFDVLADDHLYGFEDNLMAHRAAAMGYKCAVDLRVKLRNIQRWNSLDVREHGGERRAAHVERLRPEYERRVQMIHNPAWGRYYVDADGQPAPKDIPVKVSATEALVRTTRRMRCE